MDATVRIVPGQTQGLGTSEYPPCLGGHKHLGRLLLLLGHCEGAEWQVKQGELTLAPIAGVTGSRLLSTVPQCSPMK